MASELFNKNVAYFKDLSPSILEAAAPYLRSYAPDELPREHPKHKCIQFRGLAPQRDTVDAQTFAFLSNVLLRADAQKIAFLDQPATANAYFLVLVGIPTKAEIAQIIKEFDPAHLMIVEPDHRCFAKSLSEIDWPSHINDLRALGCLTHFILDTQLDIVIENIWRLCRRVNPARADNMACLVFDHHEFGEHLLGALSRDVNMISTNLGFFHDEIMMLWNAYANLSAPNTRLYDRGGERRLKATAFVVGSGPSLDNDIAFIRAHADRVIIISAGSALDPLLQNKITPDFHIENENVRVVDRFVEINKTFDLKQLKLVASTTVERSATNMFHEAVVYNRQALSTYPMFGGKPENTMYLPDPTVGNAALCFALEAGFEEIVLFGLDMGVRDPGYHHSKQSIYYTRPGVEHDVTYDITIPANFGGDTWTSQRLLPACKNMGDAIFKLSGKRRIVNCADGALIQGASPCRSDTLAITHSPDDKRDAMQSLMQCFAKVDAQHLWDGAAVQAAIANFGDQFRGILANHHALSLKACQDEIMRFLRMRVGYLDPPTFGPDDAILLLFRGTILSFILNAEHYRLRLARDADRAPFDVIIKHELLRAFDAMAAHANHFLGGDAPKQPPAMEDRIAPEGVVLPPLRSIERNENCYCNSGKKFKHCHGTIQR